MSERAEVLDGILGPDLLDKEVFEVMPCQLYSVAGIDHEMPEQTIGTGSHFSSRGIGEAFRDTDSSGQRESLAMVMGRLTWGDAGPPVAQS